MQTVGQIFQTERKRQKKTLEEVGEQTKIPLATLKKIEADQFSVLPPATFTKGFLRNYAQNLKIDPKRILAVFRRDFIETKKGTILPKELYKEVDEPGFGFNPRTFSWISIGLVVLALLVYFGLQLRTLFVPPKIYLKEIPATTTEERITVEGRVSREAVVTINDQLVLMEDRNFSQVVELQPGKNNLEIKAVDRRKKQSIVMVEVSKENSL
jgi:cytoskeletal protein RodZ